MTLLEIFNEEIPFKDYDMVTVAVQVAKGTLTPASFIPRGLQTDIELVLKQCFQENPDHRPDFEEICRKLDK